MARSAQLQADRGNPRLKFLDRYVGIPLVAVLSIPRRLRGPRPVPTDWRTLGVLLTSGIGDTVVATGVLHDLRTARPAGRIVLFVTANNAAFARLLTDPDAVVELPVRRLRTAVRMLRREHCDVVIDLSAWRRFDAVLAMLSGARATIGRRTPGQHRHAGYDVSVDHRRDHELDNDRRLAAALGVACTSPPALEAPEGAARPLAAPYVVFHLWPGGANLEERSWPVDRWCELATVLAGEGLAVALTGGPEDVAATEALVAAWRARGVDVHDAAGGTWSDTLAWLAFADGVVSVNTGVMHVAAALGAPTVALNGPTSARRWAPIGPHTRCVASPMVPEGYLDLGFERDERYRDCMRAIPVGAVLDAWRSVQEEVRAAGRGAPSAGGR